MAVDPGNIGAAMTAMRVAMPSAAPREAAQSPGAEQHGGPLGHMLQPEQFGSTAAPAAGEAAAGGAEAGAGSSVAELAAAAL